MPGRITAITFLAFYLVASIVAQAANPACPKDQIKITVLCLESERKLAFKSHEGLYFLEGEIIDPKEKTMICKYRAQEWQSKYLLRNNLTAVSTGQQNSRVRFVNSVGDLNNLLSEIHHMDPTQQVENFFQLNDPSACLKYSIQANNKPPVFRGKFVHLGLDIAFQNDVNEVNTTNKNISTRIVLNQKLLDEEKDLAAGTYETGSQCVVSVQ